MKFFRQLPVRNGESVAGYARQVTLLGFAYALVGLLWRLIVALALVQLILPLLFLRLLVLVSLRNCVFVTTSSLSTRSMSILKLKSLQFKVFYFCPIISSFHITSIQPTGGLIDSNYQEDGSPNSCTILYVAGYY